MNVDHLVAEHVMGWERREGEAIPEDHRHKDAPLSEQVVWLKDGQRMACRLCGDMPDFVGEYTGPGDAWTVVDRLHALGWRVQLWRNEEPDDHWHVQLDKGRVFFAGESARAPEAICRAALSAMGVGTS